MSINDSSAWAGENNEQQKSTSKQTGGFGLLALLTQTSMTSDSRNLKEVTDVSKSLTEFYEAMKKSTTSQIQLEIIPEVETMTPVISPSLPGLAFYRIVGDTMYVMGALFSNRNLTIGAEQIRANTINGVQNVSIPLTPVDYANQTVAENIRNHYLEQARAKSVSKVSMVNFVTVDLEMYNTTETPDYSDKVRAITHFLSAEWEEGILVKVAEIASESDYPLPNPFLNEKAYGNGATAEARVSAVTNRLNSAQQLSPANMEIIISTMNPQNQYNQSNSKEVARVKASVSLSGVSFQEHMANMAAGNNIQQNFMQMMGVSGSVFPQGYRPLRPIITIDQVQSGEQMGYNGGLYAYFYGLFALMASNNNYVFAEPLRRQNVGARGNLSDLEIRIAQLLKGANLPAQMPNQVILDEKKMSDTDLVNAWIRQNVSPHATFQTNLITRGSNSAINNFLLRLSGKDRAKAVKTVINVIDAMTNKKFTEIVNRNAQTQKGWTIGQPVLHRTSQIEVNGLATYGDKQLNTQEFDEMMLCHVKGKNNIAGINDFLNVKYGALPEDAKSRGHKMRIQLNESIFDGAVHINQFSQAHVWDPNFMAVLGEAMDSLGTLNVAGNNGSFQTNTAVYAPGAGLATYTAVGTANPTGAGIGAGYAWNQSFA